MHVLPPLEACLLRGLDGTRAELFGSKHAQPPEPSRLAQTARRGSHCGHGHDVRGRAQYRMLLGGLLLTSRDVFRLTHTLDLAQCKATSHPLPEA